MSYPGEHNTDFLCDRCGERPIALTMSKFNTDMVCRVCEDKEKAHPKYDEAVEAELAAVRRGEYNYPGIGKPEDL